MSGEVVDCRDPSVLIITVCAADLYTFVFQ